MKKQAIIPSGSVFFFSAGEYSSYGVNLIARALKDIDAESLKKQWLEIHPEQSGMYEFEGMDFITWLLKNGYFEEIPHYEFHLQDYKTIDEMEIKERIEGLGPG